jgi:hypothetical protein
MYYATNYRRKNDLSKLLVLLLLHVMYVLP